MTIDVRMDSPYFVNAPGSVVVPLVDIVARDTPDPERVKRARQLQRQRLL